MNRIGDRIEREIGIPDLARILAERLAPTDLQSLLLEVYRIRTGRRSASDVLADYEASRFCGTEPVSPGLLLDWERTALENLPRRFEAVELAPLCPLGTCSVVSGISQDWCVPTARNTEVLSDTTNVLALEAALRRRALQRATPRSHDAIHLAASHRVTRAQHYRGQGLAAHFRLLGLCSAGRDKGSYGFEGAALRLHLEFHLSALRAFVGARVPLRVSLTILPGGEGFSDGAGRLLEELRQRFEEVDGRLDPERTAGRGYYECACFHVHALPTGGPPVQLVDGGFVDWTQRYLSNAKERLLVSGIGSERVCLLREPSPTA